jgi:hypothetical protein
MDQEAYVAELPTLPADSRFPELQRGRGKLVWSLCCRLDLAAFAARLSQVTLASLCADDITLYNLCVAAAKSTLYKMCFTKVNVARAQIVVYTNASSASNRDLSSQSGFCIFLRDRDTKSACLLDGGSKKCARITKSVLGAEL